MLTVAQANLIPILIAALIGLVAGWWIFRRARGTDAASRATTPARPPESEPIRGENDTAEGNGLADQVAAAASDVTGEILGVDAHAGLAGADGPPDDLRTLKGVGPKLASQLGANGIARFDQLARLSADDVAILDGKLGAFSGRVARDRLVEQAAYLARGDTAGFEATFGKLGGPA